MLLSFRLAESREEDQKIIYRLNHCENRSGWIREALLAQIRREAAVDEMLSYLSDVDFARGSDWDLQTTAEWIHKTGGRSDDSDLSSELVGYSEEEKAKIIDLIKDMEAAEDVCKEH